MRNLYKKENFKPQIKPVIENLQDELYQLENKQTKRFLAMLQNFFKVLERQNMQNIWEYLCCIYWWYKLKYSCSTKEILKSVKKNLKNSTSRRQLAKLQLPNFLANILTGRIYLMETL